MKNLDELAKIRDKAKERMAERESGGGGETALLVGMATCGIAAGARPVMMTLIDEVAKAGAENVKVLQTGCIGICQFEPVVEVVAPGKEKVTYVHMDIEKAKRIIEEHIIGGNPVSEYTIGAVI
ncbi:MAG: (2Fe-2S) ferredoxin domain-containing protein [Clostridiales Family XIII bacterium]|jgi:NADP-reducing hydrogenase subunit HndB|nr:(2Fe-2S) ferredoxin domain-containing protein [Clostridiales Family XIII bacterium]